MREEVILTSAISAGPLPSADELARYGAVHPEAPDVILREFRDESVHRRAVEWAIVTGENLRAGRGQIFALAVLLSGLVIGGGLVYTGHDVAGSVIAGADLVAGAALFVRESRGAAHPGEPEHRAATAS